MCTFCGMIEKRQVIKGRFLPFAEGAIFNEVYYYQGYTE